MSETITITKQKFDELLSSASALTDYLTSDELDHFLSYDEAPENHIYNDVKKCEDLIKDFKHLNNETSIIQRLEYYDSKCSESEVWIDNLTGKKYDIHTEIVRDFSNLKEKEL
jgi:histone acetyltransferase (RNA polymerase elongator complex component)